MCHPLVPHGPVAKCEVFYPDVGLALVSLLLDGWSGEAPQHLDDCLTYSMLRLGTSDPGLVQGRDPEL